MRTASGWCSRRDELALIEQASTRRGLRAGAYVAAAAVDAAKAATNPAGGVGWTRISCAC
ncbi:hypothetical protein GS872_01555 [Rhodococcus hoagii]|nr:hypothetical protein [Prescottella equi]